jgi:hypothetical protein
MGAILTFFGSSLGRDCIIVVVVLGIFGGGFVYYKTTKDDIATLTANLQVVQQQANDLAAAKSALESQVAAAKVAQDAASQAIAKIETDAAQSARNIRAGQPTLVKAGKSDSAALEKQVNSDQTAILQSLEDLTK